ncbi:MAG: OmpH family outer membrane protein [Rhodothermaceae bacterium]|nr:OmpH family outer membrane protein [Rhodothermaceae bacterium]
MISCKDYIRSTVLNGALCMLLVGASLLVAPSANAQQKIGYVDSDYILNLVPEFATIQQNVDRKAQEWETEIEESQNKVDEMFREYQARELLYTNEERNRKRDEIVKAEEDAERLRMRYFGPEGELFLEQDNQMRPLQERLMNAIETVASVDGYDYIFDKNGDYLFLFAREQYDLSDRVLEEMGIDIEETTRRR